MLPHRDKQNSKYLKLTSEMHTITVSFVCKSCRFSFSQVTDLISHKIQSHFDEFHKIKSIVFEESNVSDLDAYDKDPDGHGDSNPDYRYATYDGISELSLSTTETDILNGPEVQFFDINVNENSEYTGYSCVSTDDVSTPIPIPTPIPVPLSLDVNISAKNKDSCNVTSPAKLDRTGPSPLLPSSSTNETIVPKIKAPCLTNANIKISNNSATITSGWNPFVLLERLPLQLDTTTIKGGGSSGHNLDDADWDHNTSRDNFSDSKFTLYGNGGYTPPNKKRKHNMGNQASKASGGNFYRFPTQLQNTGPHDVTLTLTLAEWLKKEAEAHPQNIVRLDPDPTVVDVEPLKNRRPIPITCKLCWTKLTSVKALQIHVQNCWLHNKKRHCYCLPCEKKFSKPWDLEKHKGRRHNLTKEEREAKRRFKCSICTRGFFDKYQLRSHINTVHVEKETEQKNTGQQVIKQEQGEREKSGRGRGKGMAQIPREKREKMIAARHMKIMKKKVQTPLNYLQPFFVFPTTEENELNSSNLSLVDWLKKQGENEDQKHNVILLEPDPAAIMGPISLTNPITCKLCSRKLTSELEVRIHVKHCWLRNKQRHVYCVPCDKKLSRPTYLRTHNVLFHLPPEEKQSIMVKFVCEICSKGYFSEPDLRRHLETHKSKEEQYRHRPFICEICGFSFNFFAALRNHIVLHTDVKEFKCDHPNCNKSFKQKHNLVIHQNVHLNLKPFKCSHEGCDKAFNYVQNLKNHAWAHVEGGRPKVYECLYPGCDKKYGKLTHLKRHVMAMTHQVPSP